MFVGALAVVGFYPFYLWAQPDAFDPLWERGTLVLSMSLAFGLSLISSVCRDRMRLVVAFSAVAFNVILMDIQMPRMGGHEATLLIRALDGHQPWIVALAAGAMEGDRAACIVSGADELVSEPIEGNALVLALKRSAATARGLRGISPRREQQNRWFMLTL